MASMVNDPKLPGFSQEWTPISFLKGFFASQERKTAFILIYAVFAMTFWTYLPQAPRLLIPNDAGTEATLTQLIPDGASLTFGDRLWHLAQNSQQIFGVFLLFGLIPALTVKFLFREKLSDYGFSFGNLYRLRNLTLMTFPLVVFAMFFSGKSATYLSAYPYNPWLLGGASTLSDGWQFLLIYFSIYLFLYYLSWEFFFRGFLQLGTESSVGCFNAVLLGTLASTVVHFGPHPILETLGAIPAGLLWGFFVYRTRSILAGLIMHASLGIFLDFFLLYHFLP